MLLMEHRIIELEQRVQTLEHYVKGDKATKLHLIDRLNHQTDVLMKYLRRDDQNETDRRSI